MCLTHAFISGRDFILFHLPVQAGQHTVHQGGTVNETLVLQLSNVFCPIFLCSNFADSEGEALSASEDTHL